jgi:small conductance mechanosensitive channel
MTLVLPVLRAAAILGATWFVSGWVRGLLARTLDGRADPTLRAFITGAIRPLLLVLAIAPAMDALGIAISSFIALLSTVGLAIAISLRGSLSNAASGALLLSTRPFHVGDLVTIAMITGRVRRIGILTTELEAEDGRRIHITNDKVLAFPMEWHAADGRTRIEVILRVPRADLSGPLLDRVRAAAASVPGGVAGADAIVPLEYENEFARIAVRIWLPAADVPTGRAALFVALNEAMRVQPDA